ncbi:hypothetical protein ACFPH8_14930 [Bizionia hallyeonensis]|uniref:Beta-lactamase-inhibitor-like, PepSY-like n=1 Tax=Bizionia hallyeonensis TaxID=1123757 RepID=A0ABW0CBK5_9FLAO
MKNGIIMILVSIVALTSCKENTENQKTEEKTTAELIEKVIAQNSESFVGNYAMELNGEIGWKVSEKDGTYYVREKRESGWSDDFPMEKMKESDIEKLFDSNWKEYVFDGYYSGSLAIMKVKKGYVFEGQRLNSDYFGIVPIGTDLYKTE